jgi:hypothetical protein
MASAAAYAQPAARPVNATVLSGVAFHVDNTPIGGAKLRLRNVETGEAAGMADANGAGQFVFKNMAPGIYIVELMSGSSRIVGISAAVSMARGDSAATFVRETNKPASFRDLFVNSSLAVSSAAAALGVTAVSPQAIRPASPEK